jgi:hypothetical protein
MGVSKTVWGAMPLQSIALVLLSLNFAYSVHEWGDVFDLPADYNRMMRPNKGSDADVVSVDVVVPNLFHIDEQERFVDLNIFVTERWYDARLAQMEYRGLIEEGEIGYPIWTPDLALSNQKEGYEITSKSMRLSPSFGNAGEGMYAFAKHSQSFHLRVHGGVCLFSCFAVEGSCQSHPCLLSMDVPLRLQLLQPHV